MLVHNWLHWKHTGDRWCRDTNHHGAPTEVVVRSLTWILSTAYSDFPVIWPARISEPSRLSGPRTTLTQPRYHAENTFQSVNQSINQSVNQSISRLNRFKKLSFFSGKENLFVYYSRYEFHLHPFESIINIKQWYKTASIFVCLLCVASNHRGKQITGSK